MIPLHERLDMSRAMRHVREILLHGGDTPGTLLHGLMEVAGPILDVDRALVCQVQLTPPLVVALCEWRPEYRPLVPGHGGYPLDVISSAARGIVDEGAPIESSRCAPHPLLVRVGVDDILHGQLGVQRMLWYPFRLSLDRYNLLVLERVADDRPWTAEETEFVEAVVDGVSLALMKAGLVRELEATRADRLKSERRFRLFYDQTPSMFFTVDRGGVVRSVNRFALEHLGYIESELVGHSVLRVVHPDDRAEVNCHLDACFSDPGAVRTISFRKMCKSDGTIWVREITRVVEEVGEPIALIVCEDVTEARAHREAARQAEIKVHDKDEFMAMLGHELRNPLSPIVTALEIMRASGRTDPEVEVIDHQVAHLRRLVDDLLDISRIARGKVELNKERVELGVIAGLAAEIARPLFQRKGQFLNIAISPSGLAVDADPSRLAQAFANLLTNASKFSAEGQEVVFGAERVGDRILARVQDRGEGIEPEMLEQVFDLFVQRPQPADRAESGLGLGLTIVRNLIALHEGTVRAESDGRGRGTVVVVTLPAVAGEPAWSVGQVRAASAARAPEMERAGNILVVDDNDDARDSLCRLLALHGYQATGAGDGPSALMIADEFDPQIVLVDIGLPGMDGYELARRLRRAKPVGLRLLAVTGYGQPSDRDRSRDAGFDAHLVKPVGLGTLRPFLDGTA